MSVQLNAHYLAKKWNMIKQTQFLDNSTRVRHGLNRERQIANALKQQIGLPIEDATAHDDKKLKIDRWIAYPTKNVGLQIKYRETGSDLLFEIYDKFFGWDNPKNKIGRDMLGEATEYAVLLQDRKTIIMVSVAAAKKTIEIMVNCAREKRFQCGTFYYKEDKHTLELKIQQDPRDNRSKMVAYIPAAYFRQAKVYTVKMPAKWK